MQLKAYLSSEVHKEEENVTAFLNKSICIMNGEDFIVLKYIRSVKNNEPCKAVSTSSFDSIGSHEPIFRRLCNPSKCKDDYAV